MASIAGAVKLSEPGLAPSSDFASFRKKPYTLLITSNWERRQKADRRIPSYPAVATRNVALSRRPLLSTELQATLKRPKGFSPAPKRPKRTKKSNRDTRGSSDGGNDDDEEDDAEDDPSEGVIPEVVTNRMMSRVGLSVGIPLFIGLLFFPFFYYLKVGLKIDVPTWIPFIVSFIFFGSALLGVSYGIVSASWDPMREGSLLGWNEAKKNWPVFWQSLRGGSGKE